MTPSRDISRLIEIMAALRTPVTGCPWDLEQDFATIAPYTIEEAYEVADAITRGDLDDLREELGDLLLQVVYHARMAEEQNALRLRRRGRGDHAKDDPPPSARVRRQGRRSRRRRASRALGIASRPRRRPSAPRGGRRKEPTHKSLLAGVKAGPARLDARDGICSARRPPSASTGTTRARCSARSARRPTRSRQRSTAATRTNSPKKSATCCSPLVNLAAPRRRRSGERAARHQREVRAALRPMIERSLAREGPLAGGGDAGRDGRAMGCSEGRRRAAQPSAID